MPSKVVRISYHEHTEDKGSVKTRMADGCAHTNTERRGVQGTKETRNTGIAV